MGLFDQRRKNRAERFFDGGHLSDEALLRLLDGELSSTESAGVHEHIQSCWACRSRRQAIERAIGEVVEYQHKAVAPWLPPSPEGRAIFLARLEALAANRDRLSAPGGWLAAVLRPLASLASMRVAQIAAVLAVTAAGFLALVIRPAQPVSADEVMTRALSAESASLQKTVAPVIVQKLRISVNGHSVTRTIYRDLRRSRTVSRMDVPPGGRETARAAYRRSALDWESPLDADGYRRWCLEHPGSQSRVSHRDAGLFTIETKLSTGDVTDADLTLRANDYHAVGESFRFEDHSRLEIAELSYQVVPFATLARTVFGTSIAAPRMPVVAAMPLQPSRAELAEAEIEAEAVLHRLGADLGEQISVAIEGNRTVLIEGVVEDEPRRQQLTTALRSIGHATVKLATVSELAQRNAAAAPAASAPVQVMAAAPPLLDAELNARFPDKDQRNAYVNQTLSMAQMASARAWALNRLADRHPASAVALLSETSRGELRGLLLDHLSALREDLSSLENQLAEVLSHSSNTAAANTATPLRELPGGRGEQEDWRERIRRVHSSTEAIHESVATLLTTSPADRGADAESIEINLRTSLTQVQAELQALEEELDKEAVH